MSQSRIDRCQVDGDGRMTFIYYEILFANNLGLYPRNSKLKTGLSV